MENPKFVPREKSCLDLKVDFVNLLLRKDMKWEMMLEVLKDEEFAEEVADKINKGKPPQRLIVLTTGGSQPDSEDAPW